MLLSVILCVLGIFLIILHSNKKFKFENYGKKGIPGPIQLPFIGTKWNLLFIKFSKLHEYYANLNFKYGDIVMELNGKVPMISLFNRADIRKVLTYRSKFPFRPPNEIVAYFRSTLPNRYNTAGLLNAQGSE